jgi:dTDP-4-amino-4,6-dideoxygalactose transaminase
MIRFNKPYITSNELKYINSTLRDGKLSGNGKYTKMCQHYFEERWGFKKTLLTTSCTDALEMCALLVNIQPGDEVIIPSYTFVSTALAFVRQGARIVFADSRSDRPGIDEDSIEGLITDKTKAIVPVHYAGVACDMDKIMDIARKHELYVIEDAAQAIDSFYTGRDGAKKALGSIGHLAAFSFHETKNIQSGEGGLLAINDEQFIARAEIIWEKGTNRAEFFRGEVNKYGWIDLGSSFLPSEVTAAFLWAQLEDLEKIQNKRKNIWNDYYNALKNVNPDLYSLPHIPDFATNNGHMFYLVCKTPEIRSKLISHLKNESVHAVFHYLSLHQSPYYHSKHDGRELKNADIYSDTLVRLPFYFELAKDDIQFIVGAIKETLK